MSDALALAWDDCSALSQMVALMGASGAGKTTLLVQAPLPPQTNIVRCSKSSDPIDVPSLLDPGQA